MTCHVRNKSPQPYLPSQEFPQPRRSREDSPRTHSSGKESARTQYTKQARVYRNQSAIYHNMALSNVDPALPNLGSTPPSAEEQEGYYYGLPSRPKLVARSSRTLWEFQQDHWPIGKVLGVVGRHIIAGLWNDSAGSLRRDIFEALEDIQWTAIDILRIGYQRGNDFTGEKFEHPVTFFISVEKDSTLWLQGYRAVIHCHEILQEHGIDDVHVEMKEASVFRTAISDLQAPSDSVSPPETDLTVVSPPEAPPFAMKLSSGPLYRVPPASHHDNKYRALWSEHLGLSIGPFELPGREGTKCLYLRQKDTGKVLILTCRHVIFDETSPNTEFKHNGSDTKRYTIIQPGASTFKKEEEDLCEAITWTEVDLQKCIDCNNMSQQTKETMIQTQQDLNALYEVRSIMDSIKDPATRIIGHVIYSPKLDMDKVGRRLRDWALIELHPGKHTTPLELLGNRVNIGDADQAGTKIRAAVTAESGVGAPHVFIDRGTNAVELKGVIPEEEMKVPPEESRTLDEPAILVAKYGSGSGFSVGLANTATSVLRQPSEGLKCYTEEWCIIGQRRNKEGRREEFSDSGDSGSCVWDAQQRIGGMITSGNGNATNGAYDVSYATPVEWLLKDIKAHGYDVELLG